MLIHHDSMACSGPAQLDANESEGKNPIKDCSDC